MTGGQQLSRRVSGLCSVCRLLQPAQRTCQSNRFAPADQRGHLSLLRKRGLADDHLPAAIVDPNDASEASAWGKSLLLHCYGTETKTQVGHTRGQYLGRHDPEAEGSAAAKSTWLGTLSRSANVLCSTSDLRRPHRSADGRSWDEKRRSSRCVQAQQKPTAGLELSDPLQC